MPKQNQQAHALSKNSKGLARKIVTPVNATNVITNETVKTQGIWDTGATGTMITKSIAAGLGLLPVSTATVKGIYGKKEVNVYYVNIAFENKGITTKTKVFECEELSADNSVGMLIGMNIITMGDFAITNYQGNTTMSFRVPSLEKIDFAIDANEGSNLDKVFL